MKAKAEMSKVKFQVRYNALMLDQFTVEQMVRATGLNPESVRTELQRMKQEGLLTSERLTREKQGRGGRPALYRLTSDPEKRLALSRSVRAFYPEPPQPTRPTSRHYLVAGRILDRVAAGQYKDDRECETLLQKARDHLEFAWYDEGEPEGLIRAYIDRERARLEYLCGNDETAAAIFRKVREVFSEAKLHGEVATAEEYLACVKIRERLTRLQEEVVSPEGHAYAALEALRGLHFSSLADHPLVALLKRMPIAVDYQNRPTSIVDSPKLMVKNGESGKRLFNAATVRIPLIGMIAAGEPIPVPAENWSPLDYDSVEVTRDIIENRSDLYAVRVRGDSMIDALINDGDIVIMQRQERVMNGDMAAIWLLDRQETTLKRVYREGDRLRLQPANPSIKPIYARPSDVQFQGKVIAVVRQT